MPPQHQNIDIEQPLSNLHDVKIKTENEKINILYNHLIISIIGSFACSIVVFYTIYYPLTVFKQVWFAAVIAISFFRFFLIYIRNRTPEHTQVHLILFIIGTAASASCWGVVGYFLMPEDNFLQQMVVIITIAGVSSGAMQTLQANLLSTMLFLALSLLPLCYWIFKQNFFEYYILGVAMITYLIFCSLAAIRGNRLINQVLSLSFKNSHLASRLSVSNEELTNKNSQLQRHEQDMNIINAMNEKLQLCKNSIEAHLMIKNSAEKLFSGFLGGLTITDTSGNQILVAEWGDKKTLHSKFFSDVCWGLRSGNKYAVGENQINLFCKHYVTQPEGSFCLPLLVENKSLGMINFNFSNKKINITNYIIQLMTVFADAIKLALANIQLRERLQLEATRDPLTNLFNRRYLNETLSREFHRLLREKNSLCFAMLDLDHFKMLNDTYGHEAGDEILKHVAILLMNSVRGHDIACRFGGEEFVLVFINTTLDKIMPILEEIRKEIENAKIFFNDQLLQPITTSIGVAQAPEQGATIHDIVQAADMALYSAKKGGRNKVVAASAEIHFRGPPATQRPIID